MRVGVDERRVGAGAIVGALRDIAAGEDRDGAEKMIGILLIDDFLDGDFAAGILMRAFQADADAADAGFEEFACGVHDFGFVGGVDLRR